MILYGASGHGKVIRDLLKSTNIEVTAVFDDDLSKKYFQEIPIIYSYRPDYNQDEEIIISIGSNKIRSEKACILKHRVGIAIHSSAIVSRSVEIKKGTVIMQKCIIQTESKIGEHVIINTGASIDHECIINDFVHVSPMSVLCGNVSVGEGTHIGAGTVVIPGIKIGKWATIGAGTIVIKDVPDHAVVVGNPGRIIRYNEQ